MNQESKSGSLLTVSPSPHIRAKDTTSGIMMDVIIALAPAAVWGVYVFGTRALLMIAVCMISAVLSEALTQKILHRPVTVGDMSAAVTGLLLALNLPVAFPLWQAALGSVIAIVLVKQIFGGIGKNFMNPALTARVFLMLSFASSLSQYTAAYDRVWLSAADAVATATPLASLKEGLLPDLDLIELFLGRTGGCIGEVSTLMLLIGGAYLLIKRVISWHIPVTYLGTVAVLSLLVCRAEGPCLTVMLYELCSGGVVLGALFMATDYVTSPVTRGGRIVFGIGCGALTVLIRTFGAYPEGVSFAILIMNALVWYLDAAFRPRPFGKRKGKVKSHE